MNIQSKLLYQNTQPNPLGTISSAAIAKDYFYPTNEPSKPMRVFGQYAAVYLLEGTIWYRDDRGISCDLHAGDLFFVFPKIPQSYGPYPGQSFSQLWIQFKGPVFDLWQQEGMIRHESFIHHLHPVSYWLARIENMFKTLPLENTPSPRAACALQQFLAEAFFDEKRAAVPREDHAWFLAAQEQITRCERADVFNAREVARELHMSYANFRKKFTRLAAMPPGRFFMIMLMRRAAQFLHESPVSNKQLADCLGLCNEFHFSKRFKSVIGVPPQEFRRNTPAFHKPQ